MKITPDTNLLVRAVVFDNPAQGAAAQAILSSAATVALTVPALCEFVWVLSQRYKFSSTDIAAAVNSLISAVNVVLDRPTVEFGLEMMSAGADFADGVIAYQGRLLGSDVFVSFDKRAVAVFTRLGIAAKLP